MAWNETNLSFQAIKRLKTHDKSITKEWMRRTCLEKRERGLRFLFTLTRSKQVLDATKHGFLWMVKKICIRNANINPLNSISLQKFLYFSPFTSRKYESVIFQIIVFFSIMGSLLYYGFMMLIWNLLFR